MISIDLDVQSRESGVEKIEPICFKFTRATTVKRGENDEAKHENQIKKESLRSNEKKRRAIEKS